MTLYTKCDKCGKLVKSNETDGWKTVRDANAPGTPIEQLKDYCPECKECEQFYKSIKKEEEENE